MDDIHTIYHNNFGITFQWKRCAVKDFNKIQLVFRNTNLCFTKQELIVFLKFIDNSFKHFSDSICCLNDQSCRSIVLQTPYQELSFVLNRIELRAIKDLIQGTLFHLNFDNLIEGILSK